MNTSSSFYLPLPRRNGEHLQHEMFVETAGNPNALDVIISVHGGPGYHTTASDFDVFSSAADSFFLVRYDQRFCGKSRPTFEPSEGRPRGDGDDIINVERDIVAEGVFTIKTLVEDLFFLIRHLQQQQQSGEHRRIQLYGHSWGTTLSLAFAATYPHEVAGLILLGTYLSDEINHREVYGVPARRRYGEAFAILARAVGFDIKMEGSDEKDAFNWKQVFAAYRPRVLKNPPEPLATAIWLLFEDYITASEEFQRTAILKTMQKCIAVAAKEDEELLEQTYLRLRGQSIMQLHLLFDLKDRHFDFLEDGELHSTLSAVPIFLINGAEDECCPSSIVEAFAAKLEAAAVAGGRKPKCNLAVIKGEAHFHSDAINAALFAAALRIKTFGEKKMEAAVEKFE